MLTNTHSKQWRLEMDRFRQSIALIPKLQIQSKRNQNRFTDLAVLTGASQFVNTSNTDFILKSNRRWAATIVKKWSKGRQYF